MITMCFCKKCRDDLLEQGEILNSLYEEICEYYLAYGKPVSILQNSNTTMLNHLELNGLVVTRDCSLEEMQVFPKGITIRPDYVLVCRNILHQ